MQVAVDRMAGTVGEVGGVAGVADHAPRRVVELGPGDGPPRRPARAKQRYRRLPGPAHGAPYPLHFGIRRAATETHPGLVGEHAAQRRTGPEVHQDHLPRSESPVAAFARLVVRIGRVLLEADDRRMVGYQAGALEP